MDGAGDLLQPSKVCLVYCEVLFTEYYEGQACFHEIYEQLRNKGYRLVGLYTLNRDESRHLTWCDALFA